MLTTTYNPYDTYNPYCSMHKDPSTANQLTSKRSKNTRKKNRRKKKEERECVSMRAPIERPTKRRGNIIESGAWSRWRSEAGGWERVAREEGSPGWKKKKRGRGRRECARKVRSERARRVEDAFHPLCWISVFPLHRAAEYSLLVFLSARLGRGFTR